MALAAYGEPIYKDTIRNSFIEYGEQKDKLYSLNHSMLNLSGTKPLPTKEFEKIFSIRHRKPWEPIAKVHCDLAASIQALTEDIICFLARKALDLSGSNNLCLGGGVALNCVANGLLYKKLTKNIWIQPAAGDAGSSMGAAFLGHYLSSQDKKVTLDKKTTEMNPYLGYEISNKATQNALEPYTQVLSWMKSDEPLQLSNIVAQLIAKNKIIGVARGSMEFGPRALGNRSILANALNKSMQTKLNLSIKFRESFRPFAPIITEEDCSKYFDFNVKSPFMLLTAKAHEYKSDATNKDSSTFKNYNFDPIHQLKPARGDIDSVVHLNSLSRIQTVSAKSNLFLYQVLTSLKKITGHPLAINTSFNMNNEPIVCTESDAIKCFISTGIDILILGDFIIQKKSPIVTKSSTPPPEFQQNLTEGISDFTYTLI